MLITDYIDPSMLCKFIPIKDFLDILQVHVIGSGTDI